MFNKEETYQINYKVQKYRRKSVVVSGSELVKAQKVLEDANIGNTDLRANLE